MKIASLLPSATEIVYALGLGDDLIGVTDECDYPPDAVTKPVTSRPRGRSTRPCAPRWVRVPARKASSTSSTPSCFAESSPT